MFVTRFGLTPVGALDLALSVLADIDADDLTRQDGDPVSW
jgi:hypothetical protein